MHKPGRETYSLPETKFTNWDQILSDTKKQDVRVEIFETGRLEISNRCVINLKHKFAEGIKEKKISMPVYCYLVSHPQYGDFLVDAGLDRSYQDNTYGNVRGVLRKLLWPLDSYQKKGQDIATQLAQRNIVVDGVFFTHLHMDHTAGIQDFNYKIRLFASKDEPFYRFFPLFYQYDFSGFKTMYDIDFKQEQIIPPFGHCADIFGDGSFWAIHTPGHRKGHTSYLVNGKEKAFLLTGDACDLKLGFDLCVGPGYGSYNLAEGQRSLERIKDFSALYPDVEIIFGHEKP